MKSITRFQPHAYFGTFKLKNRRRCFLLRVGNLIFARSRLVNALVGWHFKGTILLLRKESGYKTLLRWD
jgi:hypothetical protein